MIFLYKTGQEWIFLLKKANTLLDFSKAFDKVDHNGLIYKLRNAGINNNLISWCQSFLFDRR